MISEAKTYSVPPKDIIPKEYREQVETLFNKWLQVQQRNTVLSTYYNLHQELRSLNIAIPKAFEKLNCTIGWCYKAVNVRVVRSIFDGFVFAGENDAKLDWLVRKNKLKTLYKQAYTMSLVHGVSAISVMADENDPYGCVVRAYSANQFSCIWDKDKNRIAAAIVLAGVDKNNVPTKYIAHFADAVLTITRTGTKWQCEQETNPLGVPLIDVFVHEADLDRPLGHSLLTPELLGIVDKAMRDVERMEVGAEFFTYPQRYIIGASEQLFSVKNGEDEDGEPIYEPSPAKKLQAYIGAFLAISRDEEGEVPQVGQFSPAQAENFTRVFENDAQRFSGCSCVPLSQLGVLGNNYTSSDALGAANDPLILDVQQSNLANAQTLENIAKLMMAISSHVTLDKLTETQKRVQAYFQDPSMPTMSARADAWSKIGAQDKSVIGTRVYYENIGFSQSAIDRIETEKRHKGAMAALNEIRNAQIATPLMQKALEEQQNGKQTTGR